MLNITLFVPGLFDVEFLTEGNNPERLKSLETLLAYSATTSSETQSYNSALCRQFGFHSDSSADLPIAAIARLIDGEKRPEGVWLRADPIHLVADQKSLRLLDSTSFPLTQHDALALAAAVQPSFDERGWQLEVPVPTRWYVNLGQEIQIKTAELQEVVGEDIREHLPSGSDSADLRQLLNELQMQLHSADINELREQRGELAVNSLWLWGCGSLPPLQERCWSRVYSDENTSMGLSMLSNTPCFPLPARADELFSQAETESDILIIMNEFQTKMLSADLRTEQLVNLEQRWCEPLLYFLRDSRITSINIITRDTTFSINKRSLMKIWSRIKPLNYYVQ